MRLSILVAGFVIASLVNPLGKTHEINYQSIKTLSSHSWGFSRRTAAPPVAQPAPQLTSAPPALTQAAPAPVAVPTPSTGCSSYLSLVEQYDWPVDTMMAIMQAESSCNPDAYNPSGCWGLFQLYNQDITDPAENIAGAYQIYVTQGLTAWSSYTSGAYLQYLP